MLCATVCLTVVASFSDTTDVSTICHSSKTDRSRTPLFHVAQYGDGIIGRELNLRKLPDGQWESNPQPSEQLRPMTIKTSASNETATAGYVLIMTSIYFDICHLMAPSRMMYFVTLNQIVTVKNMKCYLENGEK